jgi:hypothetical protein
MEPEPTANQTNVGDTAGTPVPGNYAFVMNVGSLTDAASYTLAPGQELRRANAQEIAFIKDKLIKLGPPQHSLNQFLWERRLPLSEDRGELLPQSEWRYFVIVFSEPGQTHFGLERAFDLSRLELEMGFTNVNRGGVLWFPSRLFHVLNNASDKKPFFVDVCAGDVTEMQMIYLDLQRHDHNLVDVQNLAGQLADLKALPHHSPLRFLGYFAILESLITHNPQPADPYDSITRQVKKKLALLNRRFRWKIDYTPFGTVPAETVWSKMYAYRSSVAHGATPRFTGELAALGNHETALALIKETVKAVLRQALTEPQLLSDLREC